MVAPAALRSGRALLAGSGCRLQTRPTVNRPRGRPAVGWRLAVVVATCSRRRQLLLGGPAHPQRAGADPHMPPQAKTPQLLLPLASRPQVAPTGLPVRGAPVQTGKRGGERPSKRQEGAPQGLRRAAGACPTAGPASISQLPASRRQQRAASAPLLLLQQGALKGGICPPLSGRGARGPSQPQLGPTSTRIHMVGGRGLQPVSCPLLRGRVARSYSKHQPGRSGRGLDTVCCPCRCSKGAWGNSQLQWGGRSGRALVTACLPLQ